MSTNIEVIKKSIYPQLRALADTEDSARKIFATVVRLGSNPKILACEPDSIIQAFTKAVDLGLNLDPTFGECDFLPYGNKLTLQLRAKGYAVLAEREGGWEIQTIPVYLCDEFTSEMEYKDGWLSERVSFIPNIDVREANEHDEEWAFKNIRLIIANARRTQNGKLETATVKLTRGMIEHRRTTFSSSQRTTQYSKPDEKKRLEQGLPVGIWREHYTKMAIKTALGEIGKKLPKTEKLNQALESLLEPKIIDIPTTSSRIQDAQTLDELKAIKPKKNERDEWEEKYRELSEPIVGKLLDNFDIDPVDPDPVDPVDPAALDPEPGSEDW